MKDKIIILCNLGGPSSLDEVENFLLDLLGDPNVIRLPFLLKPFQKNLARFIVSKRLPKSKKLYEEIGGKSPIVALTQVQAKALEKKIGLRTFTLMCCGKPGNEELKNSLKSIEGSFDEAIILPLFPQYSTTTSKSAFEKSELFFANNFPHTKLKLIRSFPDHPKFIASWVERIQLKLKQISGPVKLLFSAHGIPQSYVDSGDTYFDELQKSVNAIMKFFPEREHVLCFQSKFGPGKWLEPSTDQAIKSLKPNSQALVVPISFVSDHVETLHEIGIEFTDLAKESGIKLYRTPGLNHSSLFIECLADLVLEKISA